MAAVSLLIVYHRLSPAPHALVWAAAFALGAAQWGIIAASMTPRTILAAQGPAIDLTGIGALLLFVEGFRLRATGSRPGAKQAVIAIALLGLVAIASATLSQINSRVVIGALSGGLLAYAAWSVVPSARRRTMGETAATVALAVLAAARTGVAIAALVDRQGHAVVVVQQLIALPAAAGEGLFAMLLIASDFSAVRHRLVHTDPLTGVLNRLGFEEAARTALRRARRPVHPVSLAIADIDRFKAINDAHGHTIGDRALGRVARHFEAALGEDDIVGRIGGEEFALLLWGDTADAALRRIEPLRTAVGGACADVAPELAVTVSFGIAEQARGEGLASLLDRADRALYRSKGDGRDRSTLAEARG
jgi:diguanylate cyclase (GGDEF)-like protein